MDDRIQALGAAQQLLQSFKRDHPQWTGDRTPLEDLARWLGLEIETFHPGDYPPGTYGFLEPDENLVWLRRDLLDPVYRFTLAHELGTQYCIVEPATGVLLSMHYYWPRNPHRECLVKIHVKRRICEKRRWV